MQKSISIYNEWGFCSVTIAEYAFGDSLSTNIARAATSNKLAYGYVWSYDKVFHFNNDDYGCMVSIDKYDTCGNFIESFNSMVDGARSVGKEGITNIKSVCDGRTKTAYGYVWRYKGHLFNEFSLKRKSLERAVNQYSHDDKFIARHDSAKKAGALIGIKCYGNITNCCRHNKKLLMVINGSMQMILTNQIKQKSLDKGEQTYGL